MPAPDTRTAAGTAFDPWKNADGSYNGLAMLAELSGVPYDEVKAIADEVVRRKREDADGHRD